MDNHEERLKKLEQRITALDTLESKVNSLSSVPKIEAKVSEGGSIDTSAIISHIEKLQAQLNGKA